MGRTRVTKSSSPNPPGWSPWRSTSGSAPSTRGLEVIVSVALIATSAALIPAQPQIPSCGRAFGIAVYRSGSSGRAIVRRPITLV